MRRVPGVMKQATPVKRARPSPPKAKRRETSGGPPPPRPAPGPPGPPYAPGPLPGGAPVTAGAGSGREGPATASVVATTAASRPRGSWGTSAGAGDVALSARRARGRRTGGSGTPPPGRAVRGPGGGGTAASSTATSRPPGAATSGGTPHARSETSPTRAACAAASSAYASRSRLGPLRIATDVASLYTPVAAPVLPRAAFDAPSHGDGRALPAASSRARAGGTLELVKVGARTLVLALGLALPQLAAGAEEDPARSFGLHLVDDFRLKWRQSIPEFEAFGPAETAGWDPWGVAQADASLPARAGRLKLGLGVGRLGWNVDSSTIVEGTSARVKLRLGLDLGAGRLTLRLPDVKVTPRYDKGQLTFDWVVPLIEERF